MRSTAVDDGGDTWIHSDIIESHILNKLDGATLAAASCVSAKLLSLCTHDCLWRQICNSTWPSTAHPAVRAAISAFPSRHRSFYSDSFPAVRCPQSVAARKTKYPRASELISAVDIFFDDALIHSKVLQTETLSGVFLCSAFRIDLLGRNEPAAVPLKFDGEGGECMQRAAERLRVSWILIDPSRGRAVKVASAKAVDARWECLFEDKQLRYATVVDGGDGELVQWRVEVNCGGDYGGDLMVREVSLEMENTEGRVLTGFDSLVVIETAMEGERRVVGREREKEVYEMFMKMQLSETRQTTTEGRMPNTDFKVAAALWIFCVILWRFFMSTSNFD